VILERWVVSLSKYTRLTLKIADRLIDRINLEPIEGENGNVGVKAVWVGEPGRNMIELNAQSLKGSIQTEGNRAPTIEYWQKGERRGFALGNPKSISCELDEKTLRNILTPKAAGIAMAAGAAIGLVSWFATAIASRVTLTKQETGKPAPPLLDSQKTSTDGFIENEG
jgi:hypothetical protein